MTNIKLVLTFLLTLITFPATMTTASADSAYKEIEWADLIPEDDLKALLEPPEELFEIEDGSEEDQISSGIFNALTAASDSRYQQALVSTQVRPEYDQQKIRLPGFVVPVSFNENQLVTEFFLVPYFGACIHVPPPPPNQIIFSRFEKGLKLQDLYTPYWIDGTLSTSLTENEIATSAYSFAVDIMEVYSE
jgi:hypothetical protein